MFRFVFEIIQIQSILLFEVLQKESGTMVLTCMMVTARGGGGVDRIDSESHVAMTIWF